MFENGSGYRQNVWFWHILDGRVLSFRDPYSVPALLRNALQYGFRRQGDQFFVRISSNKSWRELDGEPLVREILTNLSAARPLIPPPLVSLPPPRAPPP